MALSRFNHGSEQLMHYPGSDSNNTRKLWHFNGGLHLPDNKSMSLASPAAKLPLPDKLVIPLQQHIGELPELSVKVGDHVLKGQLLAEAKDYVSASVHAPSSGTITAIGEHAVPHPSGLTGLCVSLETDGKDEWTTELPDSMADFKQYSASQLRERIRWAGIVGMGGATFPTGIKLNPGPGKKISTLIINAAECEPYISCDDALMQTHADDIINGIAITQYVLSAENSIIGIEDNKPDAIKAMREAINNSALQNIELVVIPTLYPSGGEKQLIRILTGQEVPSHGPPADIGYVCHNIATIFAIHQAVVESKPLISRMITVTGPGIRKPQNLFAPIGTLVSALIDFAGGYQGQVEELILGGPMMGFGLGSDRLPVNKGANCILVTQHDEEQVNSPPVACIRCGKCADVCPAQLLPQQLYWFARSKDLDKVQDYNLFDCIECGCCAHVCPSHIPLVQYYRFAKTEVWAREEDKRKADLARQRHEQREARLARIEAEKQERLRKKKEALEKKKSADAADTDGKDPKQAAIEAAMKRAAEKKQKLREEGKLPGNTENLTAAQKKQIDEAEKRRQDTSS